MRKRRRADIGGVTVRGAVQQLVQEAGDGGELGQLVLAHPDLEPVFPGGFQQQRRDDGDEISVAAPLPQPVERALNLPRARVHRGERPGDRRFGVVMGVDTDIGAGDAFDYLSGDLGDLTRQRSAIGVAKNDPARASLHRRVERLQRIGGVRLVAVEEMLGVEQRLAVQRAQMGDAVADIGEVFVQRDAERGLHMEIMGLADEADGLRARIHHLRQHLVIGRRAPGAFGHAEGEEGGAFQFRRGGEEIAIGRVGAGPAALDIVDAERIEREGDAPLVVAGEIHALRLLAVAESGVEEVEAFAGHFSASSLAKASSSKFSPTDQTCS